jgi:hypothetical protein
MVWEKQFAKILPLAKNSSVHSANARILQNLFVAARESNPACGCTIFL